MQIVAKTLFKYEQVVECDCWERNLRKDCHDLLTSTHIFPRFKNVVILHGYRRASVLHQRALRDQQTRHECNNNTEDPETPLKLRSLWSHDLVASVDRRTFQVLNDETFLGLCRFFSNDSDFVHLNSSGNDPESEVVDKFNSRKKRKSKEKTKRATTVADEVESCQLLLNNLWRELSRLEVNLEQRSLGC
jgi:hypothetical protein